MAKPNAAIALVCTALLAGCGFGPRQPPCNIAIVLASGADDAAATATMAVLAQRIADMGGDVSAQTRDGDRVSFAVNNCPSGREPLRRLLLSPGKFRLGLKDRGEVWLTEADIAQASTAIDAFNQGPMVNFRLTRDATGRFGRLTAQSLEKVLQIKWDGRVISEPLLKDPITSGSGQFGPFSAEDAVVVALALRSGALPISTRTVQIHAAANANE
jgi:preprotein translocase subunit SecD